MLYEHWSKLKENMKIAEFQSFIIEFPYKNQSVDIKSDKWIVESQQNFIDDIFENKKLITLNRSDLINSRSNIKEFILKTLMWGYPTKGRGRNIENLLEKRNLEQLIEILNGYKENEITIDRLKKDIRSVSGLGLSTITKFTHFLDTTIDGNKAVILDKRIIETINVGRFDEFKNLKGIKYDNAAKYYFEYLEIINKLSELIKAEPDQIEMFLFIFGRSLSKVN